MKINPSQLHAVNPLRSSQPTAQEQLAEAKEARNVFRSSVGELFYRQILKAMRTAQGKPAFFHGGQAEEVFQSQLDQTLSEEMATTSAASFVDPMFRQQFPRRAELLRRESEAQAPSLDDLRQLGRR